LPIILALFVSLLIISYLAFTALFGGSKGSSDERNAANVQNDEAVVVQDARRGGPARRGRLGRMYAERRQTAHNDEDEPAESLTAETKQEEDEPLKKIGKKKELKMQLKEEKKQQREAEEERREQKRQKEEKSLEGQKLKEAQREEEERNQQLEEEKIRQERQKKEEEEYQQWKSLISVESSGTALEEQQRKEERIDEFIQYVKDRKVVMLEDLAAEFDMKTMEAIELIERLDKEGRMSGLIDDRGKYIDVTREEMEKVAKYINRKGRVSIEDIARESNKLINLKPKVSS